MANSMDFLIRIMANLSSFTEGMEQAREEAKTTADEIASYSETGLGGPGYETMGAEDKAALLQSQEKGLLGQIPFASSEEDLAGLQSSLASVRAEMTSLGVASTSTEQPVAEVGSAAAGAAPQVEAMGGALEETAKSAEKVNTEGERMGRGTVGGAWGLQIAGMMLQGLADQMLGLGASTVEAGANFQSSMELLHTQAGASQEQVDQLSQSVIGLAGATATGPDVLTQGLYHLVSAAGVTAHTMGDLQIAAEGAKLGGADLEDVTNALNATMVSGISGIDNASTAMGILNATVGAGDMHMQDLADALGTGVLASIKGFGVTAQEAAAALATFGDNNIRGAQAGTELRMAVQALAAPVKGGADALQSIGLTAAELSRTLSQGGLNGALSLLNERMEKAGITGDQAGELLTQAFGKKAGVGIQVLEEQFARFESKLTEVTDKGNSFAGDWAAYTHTLAFQVGAFQAQLQATATQMGLSFGPAVSNLIKNVLTPLLNVVSDLVSWFSKLSPQTQQWIVYMAAATGVVTALGGALLIFVGTLGMASEGLAMFGISADAALGPVGLVVLGIMALIAVGTLLITHWQQVRTWLNNTFGAPFQAIFQAAAAIFTSVMTEIQKITQAVWGYIAPYLNAVFQEIGGFVKTAWPEMQQVITTVWHAIDTLTRMVVGALAPFIGGVLNGIVATWRFAWDAVRDSLKTAWDVISGVFKLALDVFLGVFKVALDVLTGNWKAIWPDIKTYFGDFWNDLTSTATKLTTDFVNLFKDMGTNILKGIEDTFGKIPQEIGAAIQNVEQALPDWAKSMLGISTAPMQVALSPAAQTMLGGTVNHVVSGEVTHTHTGAVNVGASVQSVSQQQYDQLRRQMPGYGHG